MENALVQIDNNIECNQCGYTVIANSVMHLIDEKYYCASCAAGIRRGKKKEVYRDPE